MSIHESITSGTSAAAISLAGGDYAPSTSTPMRSLFIGGSGTIVGRGPHDTQDVTFTNVPAGLFPYRFSIIRQSGTTATGLVAIF